jgi:DNA repair exonuclease SbcCD ATPase subunit
MKIIRLSAKNVKRLKAVEITPDGNMVVIGGKNGQGKSSVLDAIAYALGGKDVICREPVRRGAESAEVTCDLGDLIVRRTFTADGGGSLAVETKDGARFTSPQGRLDGLMGRLSFDPLEFARMDPTKQAETLRVLLGLDFAELEAQRASLFAQRTDVNRDGKALRARFDAIPERFAELPAEEISSASLIEDLEQAQQENHRNANARSNAAAEQATARRMLADAEAQVMRTRTEIQKITDRLKDEEAIVASRIRNLEEASVTIDAVSAIKDVDVAPLKLKLAGVEETNRKIRSNHQREELLAEIEGKRAESAALSEQIDEIDRKKRAAIASANFPVEGLSFGGAGGVTFNDLPFDQASAAEQLRASVAIGLALNPKLRVLLIRDGSLLDEDSLRLVAEIAEQRDAQLWIERVEEGGATVLIEDGSVVGAAAESGVNP